MKFKLSKKAIKQYAKKINDEYVIVGVLDGNMKAKLPNKNRLIRQIRGRDSSLIALRKGKNAKISLRELALILDAKYGIISKSFRLTDNKEIHKLLLLFMSLRKTEQIKRQIENSAQAIIRNPIVKRLYGNNQNSTVERKGFNRIGINTGTLFENIKGRYHAK